MRGNIEIYPKKDFTINPFKIAKLVKDSGVTLREAAIVAEGVIASDSSGNPVFRVSDSDQEYIIVRNPTFEELQSQSGEHQEVAVTGVIYHEEKWKKEKKKYKKGEEPPATIEILEFSKKE